ncbi:MAG: hypothetical protein M3485_10230, partial [Pseudomonadota bacterium]|nr:hypothetical protein [Pseudomonadota bacterium]
QVQGMPPGGPQRSVALQPPAAQPRAIVSASQALPQSPLLPAPLALPRSEPADPFAAQAIASPRPWPRAILPALAPAGTLSTRYGDDAAGSAFHPFEPRLQPRATASATEEANRLPIMGAQAETRSPDESGDTP